MQSFGESSGGFNWGGFDTGSALDAVSDLGSAYLNYKLDKERIKSQAFSGQPYSEGQPVQAPAPVGGVSSGMLVLAIAAIVIYAIKD